VALILTVVGSWSCNYFNGADISFTGGSYGIWTLEDTSGKCQLWDILFFSYHLDGNLEAARFFSMMAMIVGLSMVATMAQAQQAHIVSWGILLASTILFLVSVSNTNTYNIWIIFGLFSYVILTLIVRSLFIHPVHRRISVRGSQIIGSLFIFCFVATLLTLVILRSDYCTCDSLSAKRLEREVIGDPCDGVCSIGSGGIVMMVAAFFWLVTAVATYKIGVQPTEIMENPAKKGLQYSGYSRDSITTKVFSFAQSVAHLRRRKEIHTERKYTDGTEMDRPPPEDAGGEVNGAVEKNAGEIEMESNSNEGDIDENNIEEDDTWHLTWCQTLCCDFLLTERNCAATWQFWLFRTMLGFLVVIYIFLLIILIGSRVENRRAEQAPDTSGYFITDIVCAFDGADTSAPFVTFPTADAAHLAGLTVAHCGACAFCSNMPDIEAYVETRETIAESAKQCGPKAIFGKYTGLVECLEDQIGLTRECTYVSLYSIAVLCCDSALN
jgi:hypothetical protein